jgi:hypothetical protein
VAKRVDEMPGIFGASCVSYACFRSGQWNQPQGVCELAFGELLNSNRGIKMKKLANLLGCGVVALAIGCGDSAPSTPAPPLPDPKNMMGGTLTAPDQEKPAEAAAEEKKEEPAAEKKEEPAAEKKEQK